MKRNLDQLRDRHFDVLVIGGGITGAGVALDAAVRGCQVALIDKGDFASGTSSVSSKLIHGGLRYLELGQFKLVYEALHERRRLLNNAPHLVRPLHFIVPVYENSRAPRWKLRLGMTIYDLLAGRENLRRSAPLEKRQLLRDYPAVRADGLSAAASYYDAQMDDARLCLEVVKTAAEHGACPANYVEVVTFEKTEGQVKAARVIDKLTGLEFTVRARQIVNAAGPWVDQVCQLAGDRDGPLLQPTKGVHLILPDLLLSAAFLLFHPRDGRVFFVIPWFGKTLVGTTDTHCAEPPDRLSVTNADVEYLMEGFNQFFQPAVERHAILNTFVGVRPLIRQKPDEPSSLSREFRIIRAPNGLLSGIGGKYTTYRHMAELVVDQLVREGGIRRSGGVRSTRNLRLDGAPADDWPSYLRDATASLQRRLPLSEVQARNLVHRYGRRAPEVAAYIEQDPSLAQPIVEGEPDVRAELAYQRDNEMAVLPQDHLFRRTRLGLFHPKLRL